MRRKIYAAIIIVLATILGVQSPMYAYNGDTIATSKTSFVTVQTVGINPATTTTSNTDIAAVKEEAEEVQTMPNPSMDFKTWREWYDDSRADSYEDENMVAKKLANRVIRFERKASWGYQEFSADINVDVPYAFDMQTSVATSKATYTIGNEYSDIVRWHLGGCREYNVGDYSSNWIVNRIIAVNDNEVGEQVYYTVLGGKELYYSLLTSPDSEEYNVEVQNFVDPVVIKGVKPGKINNVYEAFDAIQGKHCLIFEMCDGEILEVNGTRVITLAQSSKGIILADECLVVKIGDSSARCFETIISVSVQKQ